MSYKKTFLHGFVSFKYISYWAILTIVNKEYVTLRKREIMLTHKERPFLRACVSFLSQVSSCQLSWHTTPPTVAPVSNSEKENRIHFFFQVLRNWERKRKSDLPSPSPKPFSWPTDHCLLHPYLKQSFKKRDVKAKYFREYFFEAIWVRTPQLENWRTFELENFQATQLEIRRTSTFPCSPNLLSNLQSRNAGFHNLWSPAWVCSKSWTFCLKTSDMKVYSRMPTSKA